MPETLEERAFRLMNGNRARTPLQAAASGLRGYTPPSTNPGFGRAGIAATNPSRPYQLNMDRYTGVNPKTPPSQYQGVIQNAPAFPTPPSRYEGMIGKGPANPTPPEVYQGAIPGVPSYAPVPLGGTPKMLTEYTDAWKANPLDAMCQTPDMKANGIAPRIKPQYQVGGADPNAPTAILGRGPNGAYNLERPLPQQALDIMARQSQNNPSTSQQQQNLMMAVDARINANKQAAAQDQAAIDRNRNAQPGRVYPALHYSAKSELNPQGTPMNEASAAALSEPAKITALNYSKRALEASKARDQYYSDRQKQFGAVNDAAKMYERTGLFPQGSQFAEQRAMQQAPGEFFQAQPAMTAAQFATSPAGQQQRIREIAAGNPNMTPYDISGLIGQVGGEAPNQSNTGTNARVTPIDTIQSRRRVDQLMPVIQSIGFQGAESPQTIMNTILQRADSRSQFDDNALNTVVDFVKNKAAHDPQFSRMLDRDQRWKAFLSGQSKMNTTSISEIRKNWLKDLEEAKNRAFINSIAPQM